MTTNRAKLELLKEKVKRDKRAKYIDDFELFAKEQIRIITKKR